MAPSNVHNQNHHREHAETVHQTRPVTHERPDKVETPIVIENTPQANSSELVIPMNVVSKADISRSLRELESIIDYFHQASVRGSKAEELPVVGKVLDSFASTNNLNLLHSTDRDKLKDFLTHVKAKAPVVHMSFPSKPGEPFLAKLIEWFRKEAHPYTVLHIGLQPELAAGCLVRTSNKSFDFSFRKRFEQSKKKLINALEEANKKMETEQSSAVKPTVDATTNSTDIQPVTATNEVTETTSNPESNTNTDLKQPKQPDPESSSKIPDDNNPEGVGL